MGLITLSIPQIGQPNATEDPKIATDLATLQTLVNGNLDATNLATGMPGPPGPWVALSLSSGVSDYGGYAPSCRLEAGGGVVRLRGTLKTTSTTSSSWPASGATWTTLPSAYRPAAGVFGADCPMLLATSGPGTAYAFWTLSTAGVLLVQWAAIGTITNAQIYVPLDGVTFTLA